MNSSVSDGDNTTDASLIRVGIVIPFFQRKPGLLRLAVESIFTQSVLANACCTILIAVVDDASPVPAKQEFEGLYLPERVTLDVRRQPNAGAGAARNTALSMLDASCNVVAFLDSDDVWAPNHLERALRALAAGADFYFCDAVRGEDVPSQNSEAPEWFSEALLSVDGSADLFLYSGLSDLAIVKGLVPTTSTIVHRHQKFGGARFPSGYFRFGEDQYYCLKLLADQSKVAYSSAVEVFCGRGVNIFAGNAPGSEGQRLCLIDEISFRMDALATLSLTSEAARHMQRRLVEARHTLLKQGLWLVRDDHGRWLSRTLFARPALFLHLPSALGALLTERKLQQAQHAPNK